MSFDKIHQLVNTINKQIDSNKTLATPVLSIKLNKYSNIYPQDKTIGGVARIINDMVGNNSFSIKKSDFQLIGRQLQSYGSKFAELFEEELEQAVAEPSITTVNYDNTSTQMDPYSFGDQVLANALESVFDKNAPLKMYSQLVANKALKSVGITLEAWNLRPNSIVVSDGNDKFIIIKADYDTPKGLTSFYVPVEVSKNDILDPEVFMGSSGPEDLNHTNIKAYLTQEAGVSTKIGASDILDVLVLAASDKRDISATELAVIRLNSTRKNNSNFFQDQIVGLHVEAAPKEDVYLPKSDEFVSFEKQFTSPQGLAAWQFGAEKVASGRNHIARELSSFGFNRPQIVVTGNDNDTIFYGVSLDTGKVAFTVPVKLSDGKLNKPSVLLCNGSLTSFDKAGINQLVSENKSDIKVAAVASNMSVLKPSEIISNLRQAMVEENHAKAEDALNVLANCGDKKAYDSAFQIYMDGLSGNKVAETKCSHMMKTAVSEYPVCSHTGLPINKVYQDKDGNCRPMFRKGMSETYEGASFMNSKIFG